MWGTFLSEPLDIVGLVGRCPANYLISRMPILHRQLFHPPGMPPEDVCGISRNFSRLSPCEGQVAYALLTRAPVADRSVATPSLPLDLHVLSLSLAFILSQDQTLRCLSCSFIFLCHSDSQTNNLGSSRHLRSFLLLTEGFRPLPSSCLFIASFQCSLRRFLFGKRLQRYCLYF